MGFLGPSTLPRKVLLLGLGDGAAIRPVLSSGMVRELTCVDFDENSLAKCRKIYAENFPHLAFRTVRAEALDYLGNIGEQYDVIVVDLYTRRQYAPAVFHPNFQDLLAERLRPLGHIVCNAYGIPTHLRPFEGNSPQAFLAHRFADKWGTVRYLPYRRNATLIVGGNQLPNINQDLDLGGLRLGDRLALELMRIRLRSMPTVLLNDTAFDPGSTQHSKIDEEMRRRWLEIVPVFDSFVSPNFRIKSPHDFVNLIGQPELCSNLLTKLAAEDHELLPVLPNLIAGEFNNRDIDASWLIDWSTDYFADFQSPGRQRFTDFCLPQVLSIVINGKNKHRSAIFALKERIGGLSNSLQL